MLLSKYKIIFIDETQDTSFAEYRMIKKMELIVKYICAVIFKQYTNGGSEPVNYRRFTNTFKPKVFVFNVNYRSTQTLSNACFGLLKICLTISWRKHTIVLIFLITII